jgi:chorismate synthase
VTTLRLTTAGESHGPYEVCVLEGIPAGLSLTPGDVDRDLARRQVGYGRGGRMKIETDRCRFAAGVRLGFTIGSPVCILVENADHANWSTVMSPEVAETTALPPGRKDTVPRPGHADLSGVAKYGHSDIRSVLERASARETVGRVAGGAVCRRLLGELGVTIRARVVALGPVTRADAADYMQPDAIDWEAVEASPVACDDDATGAGMCDAIDAARDAGESLGGVFEIWIWGLCPGLGGYATMRDRLDGRLMGALGSIPAIKGVEIGDAFGNAQRKGSEVHDPLVLREGGGSRWIARDSNRAAGLEGGMTNGMPVILRVAMKPIPTLTTPLGSVDIQTLEARPALVERSDVAAVPAARVVGEAMTAYVMAAAYVEKFGGDSMADVQAALGAYRQRLEDKGLWRSS